jgi:superfamily I DNA/RNA helicase
VGRTQHKKEPKQPAVILPSLFDGQENPFTALAIPAPAQFATRRNSLSADERSALLTELNSKPMNSSQREAVMHEDGPMLVLAGAGSGKTRVAIHRIANLVAQGNRPRKILAVTFTNKACDELYGRCEELLSEHTAGRPTILTLHGLGSRILRNHAEVVSYPAHVRLVSDIYEEKFLQRGLKQLQEFDLRALGRDPIEKLKAQIGLWKSKLIGPREIAESGEPLASLYRIPKMASSCRAS